MSHLTFPNYNGPFPRNYSSSKHPISKRTPSPSDKPPKNEHRTNNSTSHNSHLSTDPSMDQISDRSSPEEGSSWSINLAAPNTLAALTSKGIKKAAKLTRKLEKAARDSFPLKSETDAIRKELDRVRQLHVSTITDLQHQIDNLMTAMENIKQECDEAKTSERAMKQEMIVMESDYTSKLKLVQSQCDMEKSIIKTQHKKKVEELSSIINDLLKEKEIRNRDEIDYEQEMFLKLKETMNNWHEKHLSNYQEMAKALAVIEHAAGSVGIDRTEETDATKSFFSSISITRPTDGSKDAAKTDAVTSKEAMKVDLVTPQETAKNNSVTSQEMKKVDSVTLHETKKVDLVAIQENTKTDSLTPKETSKSNSVTPNEAAKNDPLTPKETVTNDTIMPKEVSKGISMPPISLSKTSSMHDDAIDSEIKKVWKIPGSFQEDEKDNQLKEQNNQLSITKSSIIETKSVLVKSIESESELMKKVISPKDESTAEHSVVSPKVVTLEPITDLNPSNPSSQSTFAERQKGHVKLEIEEFKPISPSKFTLDLPKDSTNFDFSFESSKNQTLELNFDSKSQLLDFDSNGMDFSIKEHPQSEQPKSPASQPKKQAHINQLRAQLERTNKLLEKKKLKQQNI